MRPRTMEAVVAGEMNCTVECNPLFGPKVYDVVDRTRITDSPVSSGEGGKPNVGG